MKTAISIPDSLFDAADRVARRLGLSRSGLYCRAIQRFVEEHQALGVTEALNAVYANPDDSALDPVLAEMQTASISLEPW